MCEPVPDDEIDPVPAADTGNGEPPADEARTDSDTGNGEPPPN